MALEKAASLRLGGDRQGRGRGRRSPPSHTVRAPGLLRLHVPHLRGHIKKTDRPTHS